MFTRLVETLTGLRKLDALVANAERAASPAGIFGRALDAAGISTIIAPDDLARVPRTGPLIVVANHPTGFAEGLGVPALIEAVRGDGMALAHGWFRRWPSLAARMFLVDPQARGDDRASNAQGIRSAARWLRNGGSLTMFPAAEVARPARPWTKPEELPWHSGLAHLVRMSRATVVPVHVTGRTGWAHRLLSAIHPRLGVLALAHELISRRGQSLTVRVGLPIPVEQVLAEGSPDAVAARCRAAVMELTKAGSHSRSPATRSPRAQRCSPSSIDTTVIGDTATGS